MGLWVGFVGEEVSVLYVWREKNGQKDSDYVIIYSRNPTLFFLLATESICIS